MVLLAVSFILLSAISTATASPMGSAGRRAVDSNLVAHQRLTRRATQFPDFHFFSSVYGGKTLHWHNRCYDTNHWVGTTTENVEWACHCLLIDANDIKKPNPPFLDETLQGYNEHYAVIPTGVPPRSPERLDPEDQAVDKAQVESCWRLYDFMQKKHPECNAPPAPPEHLPATPTSSATSSATSSSRAAATTSSKAPMATTQASGSKQSTPGTKPGSPKPGPTPPPTAAKKTVGAKPTARRLRARQIEKYGY